MQKQIIIKLLDGREFIDMPDDKNNPCKSCGVCCEHFRISFYFGETDSEPNGFIPSELTEKVNDFFRCMKGTYSGGKCIALKGDRSEGTIGCEIYANRPTPCREFSVYIESGEVNPKCNQLRVAAGLPAL